ncbi:MAG: hypothetical protein ABI129_00285 [Rhodanobacter sp.]
MLLPAAMLTLAIGVGVCAGVGATAGVALVGAAAGVDAGGGGDDEQALRPAAAAKKKQPANMKSWTRIMRDIGQPLSWKTNLASYACSAATASYSRGFTSGVLE